MMTPADLDRVLTQPDVPVHPLLAPATTPAREPASPRVSSLPRAGWQMLRAAHDRLADSLAGDALGVAAIVIITLVFLFATA